MKIDASLIECARNGDQAAFTEIYNLTYKSAYGVARQIVKSDDVAADILQDAYISVFTKLDTLEDPEKFNSWFKRIVSNKCYNYLKKKKPQLFSELVEVNDDGEETEFEIENDNDAFCPDKALDYEETKRLLREIINTLPEDQSLCVLMYYVQDMSVAEIAETLGVSQNTVKSRLNYGRKKIKDEVETLEKKGTKLYGISGLALIPFLRWMFTDGATGAAPNMLSKILSSTDTITTVADGVDKASTVVDVVTQTAEATDTTSAGATVIKKVGKKLAMKIGAGVAAAAVTATGVATVATMDNTVEADDYIQEVIYCEGFDGYGAFPDLDNVVNVAELEKRLCGDSIDEYYSYCERTNTKMEDYIDIDASLLQDGELSNGDVIEFKVSIDYGAINNMDGTDKELKGEAFYTFNCTVQGLKELVKIDLLSIISSIGIDTTKNLFPFIIEFTEENYEKDFGNYKVIWGDQEYDNMFGRIEFIDENGDKNECDFTIKFNGPYGDAYVAGDKINIVINDVGDGDYHELGFVIAPIEKDVEPDRIFTVLKDGNISDESYQILKHRADEIAQRDIAGGVTFAGSFVAVDTAYNDRSNLVFAYKNNATGLYYAYQYGGILIDQNDNVLNSDTLSPGAVEFYPDYFTISSTLESYERIKSYYSREDTEIVFEINK